jgi:hypothetical protein
LADAISAVTSGDVEFAVGVRFAGFSDVADDELGEALPAWVIEDGHGLSLTFQRGLSLL